MTNFTTSSRRCETTAGMFLHQASGLYLTAYRSYDPYSGRWLSRDPIGEAGGINLYGYVRQDPINKVDRFGLDLTPPNGPNSPLPPAPGGGGSSCGNGDQQDAGLVHNLTLLMNLLQFLQSDPTHQQIPDFTDIPTISIPTDVDPDDDEDE